MKISVTILILFFIEIAGAQDIQFDVSLEGGNSFGFVRVNDMKGLRSKPIPGINYDEIDGSSFWAHNWNAAILYTPDYKVLLPEAKLNFYSNELWYKNDTGQVLAISAGTVQKVIFYQGTDTNAIAAKFVYLQTPGENLNHYFEVLNDGAARLLKLDNVTITERPYDLIQGKHVYAFIHQRIYYLARNNDLIKLPGLNKEVIFPIIQPTAEDQEWLKKNNNKLRNEKDFVAFFDYFNRQYPSTNSK